MSVSSEFGELYRCAVGIPYTVEFMGGSWEQRHYHWLDEECKALESILKEFGTEVLEPERITVESFMKEYPLNPRCYGCSQVFPRDNIVCIGEQCLHIGCKPSPAAWYRLETTIVDLPSTTTFEKESSNPMVEGGDVMFLNDEILLGYSDNESSITNSQGSEWLRLHSKGYRITYLSAPADFVHLDMALSVVNPQTLICSENMPIPKWLTKNMEVIRVPLADARKGLINGLSLSPDVYITPVSDGIASKTIIDNLTERNVDVI